MKIFSDEKKQHFYANERSKRISLLQKEGIDAIYGVRKGDDNNGTIFYFLQRFE